MYVDMSIDSTEETPRADNTPDELERLSRFFKALSEPTRLKVVLTLSDDCRPVSEIATATRLPQPSVSHHLRILRDAGIARPDRRGNQVYY